MALVFADVEDVEVDLMRPLTQLEQKSVKAFLEQALDAISDVLPAGLPTEEGREARRVRNVQARLVARRVRGADGLISEGDGQYSYRSDRSMRAGTIRLTAEDLEELGVVQAGLTVWNPNYMGGLK